MHIFTYDNSSCLAETKIPTLQPTTSPSTSKSYYKVGVFTSDPYFPGFLQLIGEFGTSNAFEYSATNNATYVYFNDTSIGRIEYITLRSGAKASLFTTFLVLNITFEGLYNRGIYKVFFE